MRALSNTDPWVITKRPRNRLCTIKGQLYFPSRWNFQLTARTVCLTILWVRYDLFIFKRGTSLFYVTVGSINGVWMKMFSLSHILSWTTLTELQLYLNIGHYMAKSIWSSFYMQKSIKKTISLWIFMGILGFCALYTGTLSYWNKKGSSPSWNKLFLYSVALISPWIGP